MSPADQAIRTVYQDADHRPTTPTIRGDTIAFTAQFPGGGELFRYRLSGGLERLTDNEEHDLAPVIESDGDVMLP